MRTHEASEAATASDQPYDHQEQNGADRRMDDLPHHTAADCNAELWEEKAGDQRAGNADEDVADDAEAGAAYNLSGQPARDQADK